MSIVKSNPTAETEGLAPKMAWPTVAVLAIAVLTAVLDALDIIDVDDGVWLALFGAGGGVGVIAHRAPAALQKTKGNRASRTHKAPGTT